ncbi:hypothetical protein TNIN_485541 [Trichonephila inaurata madagascariensis]|uniref:Uncharacterized protein n=1 Tax=Trichonephila inaurata madagascariensis TaxID=2747483 RepID=A0A8X7CGC0_9ARAC|nr:hypothetical protein TNIN_485541 [Trichonephila inaurata madagascariensis]
MISPPFWRFSFELVLELFEHCSPIQSFDGVVPDSTLDAQPVSTATFVPRPGTTVSPRTPHRGVDQTTAALDVASFSVWKICQALDLPATYDPQLVRTTVFRKPHKPIPVVKSTAVFELCKALNLTVKLAPQ